MKSRYSRPSWTHLGVVAAVAAAAAILRPSIPTAQQANVHLNPVVAKLAEGKTVYGLNTGDFSLTYARAVARQVVQRGCGASAERSTNGTPMCGRSIPRAT